MTKKAAADAITAWCRKRKMKLAGSPRHVHAASYVIGYAAPRCLVVARPWMESESHMREFDKAHPLTTVHTFDESLRAGDWCVTAYVSTGISGERVACPIVVQRRPK